MTNTAIIPARLEHQATEIFDITISTEILPEKLEKVQAAKFVTTINMGIIPAVAGRNVCNKKHLLKNLTGAFVFQATFILPSSEL
jgi:hypothetical protein